MESEKKALVILGMHRSGTSMLAGCLHLLGVNLGRNLLEPHESNPAGHYENQDIVLTHDILLRDLGCRWDMIGSLPADWRTSEAADRARERINAIIDRDFADHSLWAVKDPRLCRLMPMWMDIFEARGVDPGIILLARHPFEVAASLQQRDGIELVKGHLLWLIHNREALSACRGRPHVLLTFDRVLADPVSSLKTIQDGLDVTFPKSLERATQELIAFARPDLKHHHSPGPEQRESTDFAQYAWLYDRFRLGQSRALQSSSKRQEAVQADPASKAVTQQLSAFPLIGTPMSHTSAEENSQASRMFDDLLGVLSRYEKSELDLEKRRLRLLLSADQQGSPLYAQIHDRADQDEETFAESLSRKVLLAPDEWQQISVDINQPELVWTNRLRFDPLNRQGIVNIQALSLVNASTDAIVWSATDAAGFDQCAVQGQALVLGNKEGLLICATGPDPFILLPELPDAPDAPLRFEAWLKVSTDLDQMARLWDTHTEELNKRKQELEEVKASLDEAENERSRVTEQLEKLKTEHTTLQQQWKDSEQSWREKHDKLEQDKQIKHQELEEVTASRDAAESERSRVTEQLEDLVQENTNLLKQWEERTQEWREQHQELEGRLQKEESQVQHLEEKNQEKSQKLNQVELELQEKNNDLQELKDKIAFQENLTREYFTELAKAEQELVRTQDQTDTGTAQAKELKKLMQQLEKDLEALLGSARWRVGNRLVRMLEVVLLRKKRPLAVDHMQEVVARSKKLSQKQAVSEAVTARLGHASAADLKQLRSWMNQLQKDVQALERSQRWRLGNSLIRMVEVMLLKQRQPLALDDMHTVFQEFEAQSSHYDWSWKERERLEKLIQRIGRDVDALVNSKRWKVGNGIFAMIDRVLLRGCKPTAVDHMLQVVADFKKRI